MTNGRKRNENFFKQADEAMRLRMSEMSPKSTLDRVVKNLADRPCPNCNGKSIRVEDVERLDTLGVSKVLVCSDCSKTFEIEVMG